MLRSSLIIFHAPFYDFAVINGTRTTTGIALYRLAKHIYLLGQPARSYQIALHIDSLPVPLTNVIPPNLVFTTKQLIKEVSRPQNLERAVLNANIEAIRQKLEVKYFADATDVILQRILGYIPKRRIKVDYKILLIGGCPMLVQKKYVPIYIKAGRIGSASKKRLEEQVLQKFDIQNLKIILARRHKTQHPL